MEPGRIEKKFRLTTGSVAELSRIDLEMRTLAWTPETLRIADECIWSFRRAALPDCETVAEQAKSAGNSKRLSRVGEKGRECLQAIVGRLVGWWGVRGYFMRV